MTVRRWCTSADSGYLPRLRVLVDSMRRHVGPFRLHVLAWGADVVAWCRAQPEIEVEPVGRLLGRHPELQPTALPGPPRQRVDELMCTWRWWHILDVLRAHRGPVTSIDADVMFFGDPSPVFEEIGTASMAVLPHALAPRALGLPGVTLESHARYGLYNGGWVYFDACTLAADMAEYVRQWCYSGWRKWPDGRETFGDQGTLSVVLEQTSAGHVIQHPGACPGPWNIHRHPLQYRGHVRRDGGWRDGKLFFGDRPLVAFHYQGFRWAAASHPEYEVSPAQEAIIYDPYRAALSRAERP